ncbi:MAG: efflux transporter periplasmic adaptor subunit [Phycisphaeraceae bacterium]|nr:efflux transporter periplasmic adaptor subunit [Phycisphaeraceae bacterium]
MNTEQDNRKIPKSISIKWLLILVIVFLLAISAGVYFAKPINATVAKLTPTSQTDDHDHQAGDATYYTCGMHPWIILPKAGTCPICQMDLTPLDPAKFSGEVSIDPVIVQNMGIRTQTITRGPLVKTINTVGTVAYNETLLRDVNIKIAGWVEKLHVDYLGAQVKQGDALFDLYSPELYAAQQEYLIAHRANGDKDNPLLESARTRLQYFDITDQQIANLQASEKPSKTLSIQSPYSGVVIAKHVNEGMKLDAGMQVFRIADLSKIWVIVTLYEYQLPYIQTGNKVTMSLPYIPGHTFEGSVVYIYPYLDTKTREVQVRLEFENPDGLLKPGMFANVTLENKLASDRILAPREAIIDTGERQVAFVALGNGRFQPRDVMTGIQTQNDEVEILQGLSEGENVVTSGQFLIDSEAKIRASLARMLDPQSEKNPEKQAQNVLSSLIPSLANAINDVLKTYLSIGDQLAADSTSQVTDQAQKLAKQIDTLTAQTISGHEHFWHEHPQIMDAKTAAIQISNAKEIKTMRQHFAILSINLAALIQLTGVPATFAGTLDQLHCPMFRDDQGGSHWMQASGDVRNPYFGASMLKCFDTQDTLPVTPISDSTVPAATTQPAEKEHAMSHDPATLVTHITDSYLAIQHQLTLETLDEVAKPLKKLNNSADMLAKHVDEKLAQSVKAVSEAAAIKTTDIKAFRDAFAPLSDAMTAMLKQLPDDLKPDRNVYLTYCPMVKKHWLQGKKEVRNPYAPYMLACGSIKEQLLKSDDKESEK